METAILYILLIIISIDFWIRSQGIVIEKRKIAHPHAIDDFHSVFRREGIEVDENTYNDVCRLIGESNVEAAEYLMMIRCKEPVKKIRDAVAELFIEMRGGW